jgi:aminocarboxymuconate-semialdehyde decarboxylase
MKVPPGKVWLTLSSLEFLVASAGANRVFLGNGYPYDMGTGECVGQVRAANISQSERDTILGGDAAAIVGKKRRHL